MLQSTVIPSVNQPEASVPNEDVPPPQNWRHAESSRVEFMPDLHLQNFVDRLVLEHNMLKASTRHMVFSLSFVTTLVWLLLTSSGSRVIFDARQRIISPLSAEVSESMSSTALEKFLNGTVRSVLVEQQWAVWISRGEVAACSAGKVSGEAAALLPIRNETSGSLFPNSTSCFSESELTVISGADYVCLSDVAVAVIPQCVNASESYSGESELILPGWTNQSLFLGSVPLLRSVNTVGITAVPALSAFAVVDLHLLDDPPVVSVNIFPRQKNIQSELAIAALSLSTVSLALDIKNVVKKSILSRRIRVVKLYTLFNSLSLGAIVCIRWIFFGSLLPSFLVRLDSFSAQTGESRVATLYAALELKWWRNGVNWLTLIFLFSASTRLLRILSAHPKTSILSDIQKTTKFELTVWLVQVVAVFTLTVLVYTKATGIAATTVGHWLVQVPFGVWQFEARNRILLLAFGIGVFHLLLPALQAVVNRSFAAVSARRRKVANELHEDLWLALRRLFVRKRGRHKWPHRLVLLVALERIRDSRPVTDRQRVSFKEVRDELKRVRGAGKRILQDPPPPFVDKNEESKVHRAKLVLLHSGELQFEIESLNEVWNWYYERFGVGSLFPSADAEPLPISEIITDIKRRGLMYPSISEDQELNLPPVSEIKQRTSRINTILSRMKPGS